MRSLIPFDDLEDAKSGLGRLLRRALMAGPLIFP
jgi:hypothetical protein